MLQVRLKKNPSGNCIKSDVYGPVSIWTYRIGDMEWFDLELVQYTFRIPAAEFGIRLCAHWTIEKTENEWIPMSECVHWNTNTLVSQDVLKKVWKSALGKTQYGHCHSKRGWMELKDERPSNRRSWRVQAQSTNVKMTMWSTICVNLRTSLTEFHSVLLSEADFAFVIHSPFCPVPLRLHRPPTISHLLCFPSRTRHPCHTPITSPLSAFPALSSDVGFIVFRLFFVFSFVCPCMDFVFRFVLLLAAWSKGGALKIHLICACNDRCLIV